MSSIKSLMGQFPQSFINNRNELILMPRENLYFLLDDVKSDKDLIVKVLSWCSRDASKSSPYYSEWRNKEYRKIVRKGLNTFLGVDFTEGDWLNIYCAVGNNTNKDLCTKLVKSDLDLSLLEAV